MIPVLISFGLVTGRWWRMTLPVATVGWPMILAAAGVTTDIATLAAAAALALANTSVGVLIYSAAHRLWRAWRRRERSP